MITVARLFKLVLISSSWPAKPCFVHAHEVFGNKNGTENLFHVFFFPCRGWLCAAHCWRATAVASVAASAVAAAVACAAEGVNYPTTSTRTTRTLRICGPRLERSWTEVRGGVRLFDLTVTLKNLRFEQTYTAAFFWQFWLFHHPPLMWYC